LLVLAPVVLVRGLLPRAKMNRNHGHYRLLHNRKTENFDKGGSKISLS